MRYYKKLIGERIYLSPINPDDSPKYCEWLNDLEISKNLLIASKVFGEKFEKEILEKMSKGSKTDQVMAIIDNEKDLLIGNCGLHDIDHHQQTAEFGILIGNKEYHNKGYGTEAAKLILDFGFNILNLHNIYLKAFSYNKRAIRSYEKCGFKTIGLRREASLINGQYHDEVLMDLLASEFKGEFINKFF